MADPTIRLDVWGGPDSRKHLARRHFADAGAALAAARREIGRGYRVDLRPLGRGEGYGRPEDFDRRPALLRHPRSAAHG